jgi:hypothetical protein
MMLGPDSHSLVVIVATAVPVGPVRFVAVKFSASTVLNLPRVKVTELFAAL